MTATKTQLVGGGFQDSEGNLLASGYLEFVLSQDSSVTGVGNICSGITIRIQLDSAGNVASSTSTPTAANQYIWANDVLLPNNSFYTVTGYTAAGQPAWGPNNQQVTSGGLGGGTFDVGTWTPNLIVILPSAQFIRTGSITYIIDGNGSTPTTGVKGQLSIPIACTVTGWVLTADQSGSAVIDVLRSTYAAFPTTASIAGTDKPTLVSVQKNRNLGPLTLWGSTTIVAGDELQFSLSSVTTCTRLILTLNVLITP